MWLDVIPNGLRVRCTGLDLMRELGEPDPALVPGLDAVILGTYVLNADDAARLLREHGESVGVDYLRNSCEKWATGYETNADRGKNTITLGGDGKAVYRRDVGYEFFGSWEQDGDDITLDFSSWPMLFRAQLDRTVLYVRLLPVPVDFPFTRVN